MRIEINFDLSDFNSYKIKSICRRAFFPDSEEDIAEIFKANKNKKQRLILLGNGNNVILSKKYYEEDFIIFSGNFQEFWFKNSCEIIVQSGMTLLDLSILAYENGLSGLEMFYDIPSSLGGAVVMNAGAGGEEIKDLINNVRYYDPIKETFFDISTNDIGFQYRNSFFQKNPNLIITHVHLALKRGEKKHILQKMEHIKELRWNKQPKNYPNAGSVFKRPPKKFVGPMIEELGLKGYKIGGAMVSEKHAGFIVNYNEATGEDIISLIGIIQEKVYEKFDVRLEVEQRII